MAHLRTCAKHQTHITRKSETDRAKLGVPSNCHALCDGSEKKLKFSGKPTKNGYFTIKAVCTHRTGEKVTVTKTVFIDKAPHLELSLEAPNGGGIVKGGGDVYAGKKVTITATADRGKVFAGWYYDDCFEEPYYPETGDYRSAKLTIEHTDSEDAKLTLYARFIDASEDWLEMWPWEYGESRLEFYKDDDYSDSPFYLPEMLGICSGSALTLTVSGLPKGLKYDAATLSIVGKVTETKQVWSTLVVSAKNASGFTAACAIPLSINGAEDPADDSDNYGPFGEDGGWDIPWAFTDNEYAAMFGDNSIRMDCACYLPLVELAEVESGESFTISGLPPGLSVVTEKYTKDNCCGLAPTVVTAYLLNGAPTKPGRYPVTITFKGSDGYVSGVKFDIYVQQVSSRYVSVLAPEGHGKVSGTGVYAAGSVLKVSAAADKGYVFAGWYQGYDESTGEYSCPVGSWYQAAVLDKDAAYTVAAQSWFAGEPAVFRDDEEMYEGEFAYGMYLPERLYARFIPVNQECCLEIVITGDDDEEIVDDEVELGCGFFALSACTTTVDGLPGSHATVTSVQGLPKGVEAYKLDGAYLLIYCDDVEAVASGAYVVTLSAKSISGLATNRTLRLIVP